MKKTVLMLVAVALLAALGACALAAGWTEYVNRDGAKVYADYDTDSKVIATLNKGDKVTVLDVVDMRGKWNEVSIKVKGKKKTGFMLSKYLDENPPCTHKWGKWKVVREATCQKTGLRQRKCTKCGAVEEGTLPKTEHTYGRWRVTREPTCTKEGQRTRTCTVCGHKQTQAIEKEPHEWGKWNVTKEPTCTAKGRRTRKCKVCGRKEEQVLDKLPHDFGSWKVEKKATCTAKGLRSRTCRDCKYKEEQSVAMLPHDYRWEIVTEATDHSAGTRRQVCKVCGHAERTVSYDPEGTLRRGAKGSAVREVQQLLADQGYLTSKGVDGIFGGGMERAVMQFQMDQNLNPDGVAWPQTIQRLNHDFGPWTVTVPLKRDADGARERVCSDCGYKQLETIDAGAIHTRSRGENVRTVQKLLGDMGYNPGAYDGIYGAKLDIAYAAFAADHGVDFQPGTVWPAQVDALVNGWMAEQGAERWQGAGGAGAPVNLVLTVTPAKGADAGDGLVTYDWHLVNLGSQSCTFEALRLSYGDEPDFRRDTLTVVVDGVQLKPDGKSSASGSFTVASDWGEGSLNFCALAEVERSGDLYDSNVVKY